MLPASYWRPSALHLPELVNPKLGRIAAIKCLVHHLLENTLRMGFSEFSKKRDRRF